MPDLQTGAVLAAAGLYMAKSIYELVRQGQKPNGNGSSNGNAAPRACASEVLGIIQQQTKILDKISETQERQAQDIRELIVIHRQGGVR